MATNLVLQSPVFAHNGKIPVKYTCDGEDINPPLIIKAVPPAAKSLILIMDDPDAPAGTWNHWLVWNISPNAERIGEGKAPTGATEGQNSWPKKGYGGPCPPRPTSMRVEAGPPDGTHRYFFKLYALDTMLNLPDNISKHGLETAMAAHILSQTSLIGIYERENK